MVYIFVGESMSLAAVNLWKLHFVYNNVQHPLSRSNSFKVINFEMVINFDNDQTPLCNLY